MRRLCQIRLLAWVPELAPALHAMLFCHTCRPQCLPLNNPLLCPFPCRSVESGVVAGFQLATAAGPLCDEPMWGVAFEVEARFNMGTATQGEHALPSCSASGAFVVVQC